MDVAQRYSIAFKGLKNGTHDFDFEIDGELFEAFGSTEIKGGKCKAEVQLARAESMLTLDVTIRGSVVVECDRCLDDCDVPIDFEGQLLVKFSDEPGEYDGEVMWLLPGEDRIDLSQYLYESVVLSLPYQRVHPEGKCNPAMMEKFRLITDAELAAIEARANEAEHAEGEWEKLAELKKRMESDEESAGK